MKVARCVVLILLATVLVASCVYAEEDCTAVDAGDVCSMLQNKLQSALLQNLTNLYKIRKVFRNPVPSIISVEYEIEWGNVTTKMCDPNTTREFTNSTIPHSYMYLWTSILYFTTISPGFLQHLQLQAPYFVMNLTRYIEPFFGEVDKDYTMNAILWDGCSTRKLLSLQLFLKVDTLPCTPSERQLESSIQELTTWLQAYTDVWPQAFLKLDVEKKFYAIFPHPPSRYSKVSWKVITGIILTVAIILFFFVVFLLHLAKQYFLEENDEINKDLLHPITVIFIWNMFVVVAELWTISTTCSMELLPLSLKTTLFVMLTVYFLTQVIQCIRQFSDGITKALIINFLIQWNLFLSAEFLIAGVVPAALLAIAYPLQVLATIAFLTTGLIFCVLFWTVSLRILHERILKDCLRALPRKIFLKKKGICYKFLLSYSFLLFNLAVGIFLNGTLIAILGVGVMKGTGNIHGPLFSFLPSGIFFALSWLTHKFNKKNKKGDSEDSESEQEVGCNRSEQTRNNALKAYEMTV